MKPSHAVLAALLAVAMPAFSGGIHATDDLKPQHGGIVSQSKSDIDFELVAKPDVITIYVRDHGKPVDTRGATGKIQLLVGSEKTEAALAPAGENRLQARGNFKVAKGTKAVATVKLAGRQPTAVRFSVNR